MAEQIGRLQMHHALKGGTLVPGSAIQLFVSELYGSWGVFVIHLLSYDMRQLWIRPALGPTLRQSKMGI